MVRGICTRSCKFIFSSSETIRRISVYATFAAHSVSIFYRMCQFQLFLMLKNLKYFDLICLVLSWCFGFCRICISANLKLPPFQFGSINVEVEVIARLVTLLLLVFMVILHMELMSHLWCVLLVFACKYVRRKGLSIFKRFIYFVVACGHIFDGRAIELIRCYAVVSFWWLLFFFHVIAISNL